MKHTHTHTHIHTHTHTHTHIHQHCNNLTFIIAPFILFPLAQVYSPDCSKALPAINDVLGVLQGTAGGAAPVVRCHNNNVVST